MIPVSYNGVAKAKYTRRVANATDKIMMAVARQAVPAKTKTASAEIDFRHVSKAAYTTHGTGQNKSHPFDRRTRRVNAGIPPSGN